MHYFLQKMATASGFSFGGSKTGLFGSTVKTTANTLPAFGTLSSTGQTSATGFSLSLPKASTNQASTTGMTFGSALGQTITTTPIFGNKPSASVSAFSVTKTSQATQPLGLSTFSTPASTTGGFGLSQNLFGAKSTAANVVTPFQLSSTTTSSNNLSLFGVASTVQSSISSTTAVTQANTQITPENPRDAQIPAPLLAVYEELSKHIKEQRVKKDEIARFSPKLINKAAEEISAMKQLLSESSNGIQKDAVGVDNLKTEVCLELRFAEIARRANDVAPSMQHDFTAPMEYFQVLAVSFETRLNMYRLQLDEIETYLSSQSSMHEFSPQDLLNVLRKLNESFLALTAHLQTIHESVQAIKDKYLQYRRIVLNDQNDVFNAKSRRIEKNAGIKGTGPSPFSGMVGPSAAALVTALNKHSIGPQTSSSTGSLASSALGQQDFLKSVPALGGSSLSRSLSFSGLSSRGAASSSLGSSLTTSLFGKARDTSSTTEFQLQNPPGTKRGKKQ